MRTAEFAIAQFNESGGLNGRRSDPLPRGDRLNPGDVATRTLELIERERVNFFVGPLFASVQLATNNVTKTWRMIFNSISHSDAVDEAADWSPWRARRRPSLPACRAARP